MAARGVGGLWQTDRKITTKGALGGPKPNKVFGRLFPAGLTPLSPIYSVLKSLNTYFIFVHSADGHGAVLKIPAGNWFQVRSGFLFHAGRNGYEGQATHIFR